MGCLKEEFRHESLSTPRHKVISTVPEKAQVLIRYFETETPWGKNQAVINAEVIAEVKAKAAVQSAPK